MNLRMILLTALLGTLVHSADAQQRKCDMAITLVEPAPSAVINAFAQYNLRVNIRNIGPDTLFTGDTLYYNKPTQPLFDYDNYILLQPVNPGDNVTVTLETLNNINSDQTDQVMDYYVFVVSNPANNGRFIDTTNDDNNYDVSANVTFRAGNPTGIDGVAPEKVTVSLYPNPASSAIQFRTTKDTRFLSATINDITGRKVKNVPLSAGANQQTGISDLVPGMYMLHVETDKGPATLKFIKK